MDLRTFFGIGRDALLRDGERTDGTLRAVQTQYWLKVNTKAARTSALDGAIFPAVVTVEYSVKGQSYTVKLWQSPRAMHGLVGQPVTVCYDPAMPQRCAIL